MSSVIFKDTFQPLIKIFNFRRPIVGVTAEQGNQPNLTLTNRFKHFKLLMPRFAATPLG